MADSGTVVPTNPRRQPMPKGFWTIWTTVALDLIGFGIVAPILGRYATRFDASGVAVGALFASYSLAQVVFAPILGRMSDRIGRKPVIIVSLVGTAIGSFVTGAAGALWVLFVGRILDGASGASVAVAQGAITDIAAPERRPQLLGMLGAAFGVGFVIGPAIGGLAALGGPHIPFYVAGTLALVNAIVAWIRLPETSPSRQPHAAHADAGERVHSRSLSVMATVTFISVMAFAGFESTFSLFGKERFDLTEGSAAGVFVFVGLVVSAVQAGAIGALSRRFHSRILLASGLLVVAIGMFTLSVSNSWPVLFVALAFLAAGQGVTSPSSTAIVSDMAPSNRRGETLGYVQSAGAMARVVGPLVAGVLFEHVGVGWPYIVGGALTVLAVVLFVGTGLTSQTANK